MGGGGGAAKKSVKVWTSPIKIVLFNFDQNIIIYSFVRLWGRHVLAESPGGRDGAGYHHSH